MSYILEALKKKEHEKRVGQSVGLDNLYETTTPPQQTTSRTKIVYLSIGIIAVNCLIVAIVIGLWPAAQTKDFTPAMVTADVTPGSPNKAEPTPKPTLAETNAADAPSLPHQEAPAIAQAAQKAPETNPTGSVQIAASPLTENLPQTAHKHDARDIPSLLDLPEPFQRALPELKFNAHFYSTDTHSGSVIVNGKYYKEGAEIMPGLQLQEITKTGVVLSYQGRDFSLEVLGNWVY